MKKQKRNRKIIKCGAKHHCCASAAPGSPTGTCLANAHEKPKKFGTHNKT